MTGLIEDKEQLGIKMLFYKNSVNNIGIKITKTDILDLKLLQKILNRLIINYF